jgi:hypothetical protein
MKIIKNKNITVYYYKNIEDLMKEENLFEKLQIRLDNLENAPVKVCPRSKESYILLLDSGNKDNDLKKLNEHLSKLNMRFDGEL